MSEPPPGEWRQEKNREYDPTMIAEDDPELLEEIEDDSFASILKGETLPRVKITTSGSDDEKCLQAFGESLADMMPNTVFSLREGESFKHCRESAIEDKFTDLIILIPYLGKVSMINHLHLPNGPSALWRVSNVSLPHQIEGFGKTTHHYPEVQMHNFETRLGRLCSRMLRALFPAQPEYYGRRVMTFHQQRDFIFFRHYRYIFESQEKARLQECGPRFTLKLMWLQEGPFDPINGPFTFYRQSKLEESRLKWWL